MEDEKYPRCQVLCDLKYGRHYPLLGIPLDIPPCPPPHPSVQEHTDTLPWRKLEAGLTPCKKTVAIQRRPLVSVLLPSCELLSVNYNLV